MPIPHPDNANIGIKAPLFMQDEAQTYDALYLDLMGDFLLNKSGHFPFYSGRESISGVVLYDRATYDDYLFGDQYSEKVLNAFQDYTGTDYYYFLDRELPESHSIALPAIYFPDDFNFNEPTEDLLLTIPATDKKETIVITCYLNERYEPFGNRVYNKKIIHLNTDREPQLFKFKLSYLDENEFEFERAFIAYGSVVITCSNQDVVDNLKQQFVNEYQYFLYEKLDDFLSLITNKVSDTFGNSLYLLPNQITMVQQWAIKTTNQFTNPPFANQSDLNALIDGMEFRGLPLEQRDVLLNESQLAKVFNKSYYDENNNFLNYFSLTALQAIPYITEINWIFRPLSYRSYGLFRAFPANDKLAKYRINEDLISIPYQQLTYSTNLTFTYPPTLSVENNQEKVITFSLDESANNFTTHIWTSWDEINLVINNPENINQEFREINLINSFDVLKPLQFKRKGLFASITGHEIVDLAIFSEVNDLNPNDYAINPDFISVKAVNFNYDQLIPDVNHNFTNTLTYENFIIDSLSPDNYLITNPDNLPLGETYRSISYTLQVNHYGESLPENIIRTDLTTELEIINYTLQQEPMPDSDRIKQITAALDAQKFAVRTDENGDEVQREMNLGRYIELIAQWLGLYFNPDGSIKQVPQSIKWNFDANGNIELPEEGYPVGQTGITVDENTNDNYPASIYRKRGNKFDPQQLNEDLEIITNPETVLRRGDFIGIHNLIQYFEALLDDFNKILNGNEAGAWVIPNANPQIVEDEDGNELELYARGEGIMTAIAEMIYNQSVFSKQITEINHGLLQAKAEIREIIKLIGSGIEFKSIPVQINQEKGYGLPFVAKAEDSPSLSEQFEWILSNLGSMMANNVIDVAKAYEQEQSNQHLSETDYNFPEFGSEHQHKFHIDFGNGQRVVVEYWN